MAKKLGLKLIDGEAPDAVKPELKPISDALHGAALVDSNSAEAIAAASERQSGLVGKPKSSAMEKYKSKRAPSAGVETAPTALKVMKIADADDFVRVHEDEDTYWTSELCFVDVPIKGNKKNTVLHLIDEDVAMANLPEKKIRRMRLALASKPNDVFFFCIVPSQNLDNSFNKSALAGIEKARNTWVQVVSRQKEGHDDYELITARDPNFVPKPKWPTLNAWEWLDITFRDFRIDTDKDPGLLRLVGAKQDL